MTVADNLCKDDKSHKFSANRTSKVKCKEKGWKKNEHKHPK